jgi:DNA-binding CsgD family transcriptional regulator
MASAAIVANELTAHLEAVTVTELDDIAPAAAALRDIAADLADLRVAAWDNISSKQPMRDAQDNILLESVFGWNAESECWWIDSRLALSSPLPRACRYESDPFWVNAKGFYTRQPNRYLDQISLHDFEKRALTRAAIVAPIHLPFGQIGIVNFNSLDPERDDLSAEYAAHGDILSLLAQRFVAGYAKANRTRPNHGRHALPSDCQLTKREVECLRWASFGKTDREISLILSRSHATVRFHIQNAGEKLHAVNRSQTIFKAAQLGFLGVAA